MTGFGPGAVLTLQTVALTGGLYLVLRAPFGRIAAAALTMLGLLALPRDKAAHPEIYTLLYDLGYLSLAENRRFIPRLPRVWRAIRAGARSASAASSQTARWVRSRSWRTTETRALWHRSIGIGSPPIGVMPEKLWRNPFGYEEPSLFPSWQRQPEAGR